MFKKLKKKIKLAKIWVIIFALVFISLIVNSIYLTLKVDRLETQIENIEK